MEGIGGKGNLGCMWPFILIRGHIIPVNKIERQATKCNYLQCFFMSASLLDDGIILDNQVGKKITIPSKNLVQKRKGKMINGTAKAIVCPHPAANPTSII